MRFLLPWKFFAEVAELVFNALDLLSRGFALRPIQIVRSRARQPALRAVHHGGHHLQIAR